MEKPKYGIKIPWPDTGYIWITENGPAFDLKPMLFENPQAAQQFAEVWGSVAKVEKYSES